MVKCSKLSCNFTVSNLCEAMVYGTSHCQRLRCQGLVKVYTLCVCVCVCLENSTAGPVTGVGMPTQPSLLP
jgi:hypothetical protein